MADDLNLRSLFQRDEREGSPVPWLHRDASTALVKHFPVATIAEDLVPLIKVGPGSKAFIVGTDGCNVAKENYRWAEDLTNWLKHGCAIHYLLLDPPLKALSKLKEVLDAATVVSMAELFVYKLKPTEKLSLEAANYSKLWATFHFAGFENATERQLWVEGYHGRGETTGRDCAFYPDQALTRPGVFDVYKSQFEFMINSYADCVLESANKKTTIRQSARSYHRPEGVPA